MKKKNEEQQIYDVIIIGAGPAGMSAAVYTARKLLKTLLISKNVGGQVTDAWEIDNYLGFSQVDPAGLIRKFDEHVKRFGIEQKVGREVTFVDLKDEIKSVTTDDGNTFRTKSLIIATGKRPRKLGLSDEKRFSGRGVTYCATCDALLFADVDVAVAGGGNSALEAALDLVKIARSVHIVSLANLTGDPIYQDKLNGSDKVAVYTGHEIIRLLGDTVLKGIEIRSLKTGEKKTLHVEGLFVEIGLIPNSNMVRGVLNLNQFGEIVIDYKCHTEVPGVFACGDVTNVPFKQVIVAAGEGAKAALAAYEYLISRK